MRIFPSQPRRKLSAELNTVGVLSGRVVPSRPSSWLTLVAPLEPRSWHDEQLRELSRDRRGSPNSRSPSLTCMGSIGGSEGMGVIGSSEMLLFASGGCASGCGIANESNRAPRTKMQMIVIRRQSWASRPIPPLPRKVR